MGRAVALKALKWEILINTLIQASNHKEKIQSYRNSLTHILDKRKI